jgi:hypothetical protein
MNWEAIGAVAEILGASAVVASLLYLARQMRHNATATQAARRDTIAQLTTDVLLQIASDAELASIFRRGQNDPASLNDDEGLRFDCPAVHDIRPLGDDVFSDKKKCPF